MPTEEFKELLDRDRMSVEAKELIDLACPLLRELVNHASHAFTRVLRAADDDRRGGENEDVAVYVLYRQLIEQVDAVEVLLSKSCVSPTTPLLRSMFEVSLSLDYILADLGKYTERSLCWTYAHIRAKMRAHELLDPSTTRGAAYRATSTYFTSERATPHDSRPAIANLNVVATRSQFSLIAADFDAREKKRKGIPPNWFSLLNGPTSRKQLAKEVQRERDYLALYGQWSAHAHGETANNFIGPGRSAGEVGFPMLRSAQDFRSSACFAASFLLHATRLVVNHFRPGESLSQWYVREVQSRYRQLRY